MSFSTWFTTYTIGQLKAVADTYYKIEMAIEVKESEIKFDTVHVSFQVILTISDTDEIAPLCINQNLDDI